MSGRSIENGILALCKPHLCLLQRSTNLLCSYVLHLGIMSYHARLLPLLLPRTLPSPIENMVSSIPPLFPHHLSLPPCHLSPHLIHATPHTCARPVHLLLVFRCLTQKTNIPIALINQSSAFTRSTQTAFFILCTPASPSALSLIYILPNSPKREIHRMKRIVSATQAKGMRLKKGIR
jgi:hypothetical protein